MSDFGRLQELARAAGMQIYPPANTAVPMVAPLVAAVGDTLSCTMGEWSGEPTAYAYQWSSADVEVGGATAASYTTAAGDVGRDVRCVVTATNAVGSTAAPASNAVTVTLTAVAAAAPVQAAATMTRTRTTHTETTR